MLKLVNITKIYDVGDNDAVHALKGIDIEFRKNEFVSILGQSGCGKTTMLNIIGGLDRYTDGDLIINGRSTKEYNDHDWDTYRNHSVGFVFQSYNLIPHQTVLSNVELALTLSGVSKSERRKRAIAALERVGLHDQINKKPNQMSGGQMQRVAIARALINDPDILLADEPTGALDSETSEQIMEILKEVARDRLVVMVTHNPELAERYSTRIIRVLDGKVIGDTDPYDSSSQSYAASADEQSKNKAEKRKKKKEEKGTSMSFFTALSLSLNNLMTKKGRTFMTSFAGSIGIIGIALILSLSSGFQAYIDKVQQDTLSSYPISIFAEEADMSKLLSAMMDKNSGSADREDGRIYANTDMYDMMNAYFNPEVKQNDLESFKAWIDSGESGIEQYASAIQFGYATKLDAYVSDTSNGILPANDYMALFGELYSDTSSQMASAMQSSANINVFSEMIAGKNGELINDLLYSQYELIDDSMSWPKNKNQVVVVVNENNEISESFLYALGLLDRSELGDMMLEMLSGETTGRESNAEADWSYDDIVGMKFKLILPTDKYLGTDTDGDGKNDLWTDMSGDESYMKLLLSSADELEVVGIIRPKEDAVSTVLQNTAVGYTSQLTDWYLAEIADSEIVQYQLANPEIDVLTGLPFDSADSLEPADKGTAFKEWCNTLSDTKKAEVYTLIMTTPDDATLSGMIADSAAQYPDRAAKEGLLITVYTQNGIDEATVVKLIESMTDEEIDSMVSEILRAGAMQAYAENALTQLAGMTVEQMVQSLNGTVEALPPEQLASLYDITEEMRVSKATLKGNLDDFGHADKSNPSTVNIYAKTFEDKDTIAGIIADYNKGKPEEQQISYTDYVALMMSSVSTIIDIISYVLIAFVSISLVVSSIMIGIITYISVLERTKEIGILRSIGASKKDISRVFNAETLIVGFVSGMLGIIVTALLNIPISLIIESFTDISGLASLPIGGAVILVCISMALTLIAGLIPSRVAAKKDPVAALRTE